MHSAYIRPGGVRLDTPLGFFDRLSSFLLNFQDRI
jgi:NADH:ubiquinone oxidoreductase subunit D